MQKNKIVIIATAGENTNILYNALAEQIEVTNVFIEPSESKKVIIKRRLKKLGSFKTIGQLLFLTLILPFIPERKARIATILKGSKLSNRKIPSQKITKISSVHDPKLVEQIKNAAPSIIFINGTRILKKALLKEIDCPIVNIHVGITPKYRGVHGGYWAVYNKEPTLFGVTLHFVDHGIDTGGIIAQKVLPIDPKDNFKTYPTLQYVHGVKLALAHLHSIASKKTSTIASLTKESQLYYHPTIWQYLLRH